MVEEFFCLDVVIEPHLEEVLGLNLSHVVDDVLVVQERRVNVSSLDTGAEGNFGTVELCEVGRVRARLANAL